MKRLVFVAALCAFVAVPTMAGLVTNGNFESLGGLAVPVPGSLAVSSGLPGWTITTGNVDITNGIWSVAPFSALGDKYDLDLNGDLQGAISQSISSLTANTDYFVSFDVRGNPSGPPVTKSINVSLGGVTQTISGISTADWVHTQLIFTAASSTETLAFASNDAGTVYGGVIDNVDMVVVPVPAAVLLGMLGLSVAGLKLRKLT